MANVAQAQASSSRSGRRFRAASFVLLPLICGTSLPSPQADTNEQRFDAENRAAMTRMMSSMTITPTGDVDRDFVLMMVPHHQGAIDMAVAELRYGRNKQLRRIAQEIMVTQAQEIQAMHLAIGDATAATP